MSFRGRSMDRKDNRTWEHFKLLIFVLFLIELILFLMAALFGLILGYESTLIACFWLGVVVAICFASIVLGNVMAIFLFRLFVTIRRKTDKRAQLKNREHH